MKDEVLKVLNMLEQGQITAEEASQLMEAMDTPEAAKETAGKPVTKSRRRLRIVVNSEKGDNVNIKIPARLITAGVKISKYFAKHADKKNDAMKDIDWDELMSAIHQMIDDNEEGEIVDVDTEDGSNVKIWLE